MKEFRSVSGIKTSVKTKILKYSGLAVAAKKSAAKRMQELHHF